MVCGVTSGIGSFSPEFLLKQTLENLRPKAIPPMFFASDRVSARQSKLIKGYMNGQSLGKRSNASVTKVSIPLIYSSETGSTLRWID